MALTTAQLTSLKAAIQADGTLNTLPNNGDGNTTIAIAFNTLASPSWTIWKVNVPLPEVGNAMNGVEVAGLTTANLQRLQVIAAYAPTGINPSLADRRAAFDDIFSGAGGTITRPQLLALWKKLATRCQRLANFSTGTGSDASPATLASNIGQDFTVMPDEVQTARNLP